MEDKEEADEEKEELNEREEEEETWGWDILAGCEG